MVSADKSIIQARQKLNDTHSIPRVNEALENIRETLPDLQAKIESIGIEEPRFNHDIRDFYKKFDFGNKGFLCFQEFTAYISFICKELQIPMDEMTLYLFAKAIDKNGDGQFDKDEIMHKYTKEERTEWFARRRVEAEAKWNAKKETVKKNQEAKEKKAEEKKQAALLKRRETRASKGIDSGSDSEKGSDEDSEDDGSGSGSDDGGSGDDVCSQLSNFSEYERFNKEQEERADKEEEDDDENNNLFGESCFYLLFRMKDEQDRAEKKFNEKI